MLVTPRVLRAQEPFGFEFRVNTYTTGTQRFGSIAGSMNYLFVVTWESAGQDGSQYGIFGQRYSSDGVPLGTEFRVNTYATGNQRSPAVGGITSQFTIVWQSDGQDGSGEGIFGQRYTPAGFPAGPEFRVNTYTSSNQSAPELSSSGFAPVNLVVLWQSDLQDGSATGIYSQKYFSGFPDGPELRVIVTTQRPQTGPGMAFGGWPRWISLDERPGPRRVPRRLLGSVVRPSGRAANLHGAVAGRAGAETC